ncbi:MAG: hypothetical protein CMB80_15470 [Flammeovirgaceae bacterium]|nr:hypothetical protein [Flammeovirgaceae bacterium]|tara:strand:+ start:4455 stop:5321 length:867 start_codon:yes stop_codon:yes gene_type:complete
MEVNSSIKPLYASLRRVGISQYLLDEEFETYLIEIDWDEEWSEILSYHAGESLILASVSDYEESFKVLLSWFYERSSDFDGLILDLISNFAEWNPVQFKINQIHDALKTLGLPKKLLVEYQKEFRQIRDKKPIVIEHGSQSIMDLKKVFLVHGHDEETKLKLKDFLTSELKLRPIILSDQINNSVETIIGKFEKSAAECSSAIILFTPDDKVEDRYRARQNVILELGYFLGKFSHNKNRKIIIVKKGNIEIPSDIHGVIYLEFQQSIEELYFKLSKQYEAWNVNRDSE